MGRQRASFEKRRKEQERTESRQAKVRKRQERRAVVEPVGPAEGDPDIDWIVPGPQTHEDPSKA
jgi:hypothetical protein